MRMPATAEHVLTQRNLYLLPTRAGWMLGVTMLLLLLGSINYQLNLGYLLTFLLTGSIVAGVYVGHVNLRGVRLGVHVDGEAFAGRPVEVRVRLTAPGPRTRWALVLRWVHPGAAAVTADMAGGETRWIRLPVTYPSRGQHALPLLRIETRYPLGAWCIWSWWRPAIHVTVYPAPEVNAPPLPAAQAQPPAQVLPPTLPSEARAVAVDEWPDAVRPYRDGDAPARVLWKKAARSDGDPSGWLVREATTANRPVLLWLDDATCGLQDVQARRSRLCAWVLQADARGLCYGLRLPGHTIDPDTGPAHRRRCLQALAWY